MSGALDRMGRLLALVPWLRSRDGITIEEAARHFHISAEQMERDLWLLVVCGVPGYGPDELIDIDFWDDGHIHVRDPLTLDQPMRLNGDEIAALSVALDALAQLPSAPAGVASARSKLQKATLEWQEIPVEVGAVASASVSHVVDDALQSGRSMVITYASGTTGHIDEREIIPLQVSLMDGRTVLDAHCLKADGLRTFRLDRILAASLGAPMRAPDHLTAQRTEPLWVRCALHPGAEWIADVHPVEVEPGATPPIVRISVHDPRWVVRLALSLGGALEVLDPQEIRAMVAEEARRALDAYASHTH